MNEKAFEKVERDLNLATGEVKITEEMINLDRFRITSESEIQPKEYTMEFLGRPCFPRKDLSVFAGVAKTGKTFVTSMLIGNEEVTARLSSAASSFHTARSSAGSGI